ncbi:DUF1302 domain-containing protein [Dechloromonas sp. HYN0024]|uniref:DUF1302 domain-containing protein n=1 Tax=Dechloromonas sp. HYN0024 TaxID=2231055 RepID=UPI001F07B101|nr:DUF1302 domain-containing protein [Dechloromonas sp. HYN0024]
MVLNEKRVNKMRQKSGNLYRSILGVAVSLALSQWNVAVSAEESTSADDNGNSFHLGGYVRGWASFNMKDQPETKADDKWKPSMIRGSLLLDMDAKTGPLKWKAVARADREYKTDYLKDLEALRATNGTGTGGQSSNIMDNYNKADIRELWTEFNVGERVSFRLGKQQIVWGESDFFHAMDVVHGYDMSWRLFFEGENEEWRKPLWLLATKVQVPEASGQIHAFIRPGIDQCKDIGNTYDIRGGRWFFQPYRGYDLTAVTDNDCRHPDGDKKDVTGGIKWSGEAASLNYSLAYIRTFAADPVANSVFKPYEKAPTGAFFDLIHPVIDVFGVSVSGYTPAIDAVLSAEVAYTKDAPYNVGTGGFGTPNFLGHVGVGLGGIMKKDTLTTMIRADKNIDFQGLLGTNRPSFSSIQLFDTMILNYKGSDDLARLFAYGSNVKEHSTILTAFTVLNFRSDTINPSFAIGTDLTNGGGFFIPAVDFVLGDKWRLKVEADVFWTKKDSKKLFDTDAPGTQLMGYFANNDQLVVRLTRQF